MEQKQESPRFILILGSLFLLAYVAFNLGTAWMDSVADEVAAAFSATPTAYMTPTVSPTNVPMPWITPSPTPGGQRPSGRPPTSEGEYPAPEALTSGDEYPAQSTPSGGEYPAPVTETPVPVTPTPEAIQPTPIPTNLATATNIPSATPTSSGNGYPGPADPSAEPSAYPGPGSSSTPRPTSTATTEGEETQPANTPTPTATQLIIQTNTPTTPRVSRTPGSTITELDFSEVVVISNGSVNQASWAKNQAVIGLATSNGIFIYDSVDFERQGSLDLGSPMASLAFTSNDNWIAAGGNDASIRVWDLASDSFVMDLSGHLLGVVRLVSSDIGNYLVSGSDDATVRIWNTSGDLLFTFNDPETRVTDLIISSDVQMVVASSNRHVHIWNPVTGMLLRTISQPVGWYQAVALSPDNFRLVTAYEDRRLEFWDTITWARTQFLPQSQRILYLDFSPDGSMLAGAYDDGSIKIWDPRSLALLADITGHSEITSMAFNPVGDQLLTSSADGTIRMWDLSPLLISE